MSWLVKSYIPDPPPPDPAAIVRSLDFYDNVSHRDAVRILLLEKELIKMIQQGLGQTPQYDYLYDEYMKTKK